MNSNQSEQIDQLATALSKAQSQIQKANKDSVNPYHKSKYADLASVWDACRSALTENGLSVAQITESARPGEIIMITKLLHSSGQWIDSRLSYCINTEAKGNLLQSMGAAITYLRRYGLSSIIGVCPADDDDGNSSVMLQGSAPQTKSLSQEEKDNLLMNFQKCTQDFKNSKVSFLMNTFKVKSITDIAYPEYVKLMKEIDNHLNFLKQQARS